MDTYSYKVAAVNNHINDQQHFIFHISSHAIAFIALIIACFAITGYIRYRNIPTSAIKSPKEDHHPDTSLPGYDTDGRTLDHASLSQPNLFHSSPALASHVMTTATEHTTKISQGLQMSTIEIHIADTVSELKTGFMQSSGFFGPYYQDDPNFELNEYFCQPNQLSRNFYTDPRATIISKFPGICNAEGSFKRSIGYMENTEDSSWLEGNKSGEPWGWVQNAGNSHWNYPTFRGKADIRIVREKCAASCLQYNETITGDKTHTYLCKLPLLSKGIISSGSIKCINKNNFSSDFQPILVISDKGTLSATSVNSTSDIQSCVDLTVPTAFDDNTEVPFTINDSNSPLKEQKYIYMRASNNQPAGEYSGHFLITINISSIKHHNDTEKIIGDV